MLDSHDDEILSRLGEIVGGVKCAIELPPSWADPETRRAAFAVMPNDKRAFPRRRQLGLAALEYRQTAAVLPRPGEWHKVYTTDISRGGLAFLHSEQLFPCERMRIVLLSDDLPGCFGARREFFLEVARCRRVKTRCYEVGGSFIDALGSAVESD